jgi:hypothetical protein
VFHLLLTSFVLLPKPQAEQTFFWAWNEIFPQRRQAMGVNLFIFPIDGVPLDMLFHLIARVMERYKLHYPRGR